MPQMYPVLCYVKTTELGPPVCQPKMRTEKAALLSQGPWENPPLIWGFEVKIRKEGSSGQARSHGESEASPPGLGGGSKPGLEGNLPHGEGASRSQAALLTFWADFAHKRKPDYLK